MADIVLETIPLDRIATEGTQTRASFNDTVIDEYAEAYQEGIELPPIEVYFDQETYWLADGFHRLKAVEQLRRDAIAANVHQGGRREAILHAVGANEDHGLRRTNADRRKAVQLMLDDPEWSAWANTEIARQCHVSEYLVRSIRNVSPPATAEPVKEKTRQVRRGTTTYPMKTERIGTQKPKKTTDVPKSATAEEHVRPSASVSSIQSKIDDGTTAPAELETAVDQELAVVPDIPPASQPTAESEPDDASFGTATVISAEAAAEISLEDAWEWATQVDREGFFSRHSLEIWKCATRTDREAFVADHRDQLQKILETLHKKLDRHEVTTT